jgi:NADH:ubiquinone oxidoreductase subunit B-like Fe-S oxidoreductase
MRSFRSSCDLGRCGSAGWEHTLIYAILDYSSLFETLNAVACCEIDMSNTTYVAEEVRRSSAVFPKVPRWSISRNLNVMITSIGIDAVHSQAHHTRNVSELLLDVDLRNMVKMRK